MSNENKKENKKRKVKVKDKDEKSIDKKGKDITERQQEESLLIDDERK